MCTHEPLLPPPRNTPLSIFYIWVLWNQCFQVCSIVSVPDSLSQSIQFPFTEEPTIEVQAAKKKAVEMKKPNVAPGTTIMRKLKGREQEETQVWVRS